MYLSFRTNIPSVGISDRTTRSTGAHMSPRKYSIMRRVFTCKQDATVELLVLLSNAYTHSFFRDKGEAAQKSSSAAKGWYGSHGVLLRREYWVLYSNFVPAIIFERSVQVVGCVWPYAKGHTQCCMLDKWKVYNCNFQLFPFFLRLLFKELALQPISKSDSRISIRLYSHTTESLSRYVHLL